MASPLERAFYIRFDAHRGSETALVAGDRRERAAAEKLVVRHGAPLVRVLRVLGSALRATGLLLVASPLLFVVKLVLAATLGPRESDIVIPFFVIVVVTFFALLNLAVLVFAVHWAFFRQRVPPPTFAPMLLGSGVAPSASASVGAAVRARGRVVPLEEGVVVLRSAEAVVDAGVLARVVELRCFAVVADDDETPPVVVHGPWTPTLLPDGAAREPASFGADAMRLAGADAAAFSDVESIVLRAGDRVEVTGLVDAVFASADRFELDGATASLPRDSDEPYRGGAPRVVLAIERAAIARS